MPHNRVPQLTESDSMNSATAHHGRAFDFSSVLACAWLIAFFLFFFSFTLPNSKPQTSRQDIWSELPDLFVYSAVQHPDPGAVQTGWRHLPQRFDLMLVATTIMAGAWGLGHLLLRLVQVPLAAHCLEKTVFAYGVGLSGLSLIVLGCGLAGLLSRPLFLGLLAVCILGELSARLVAQMKSRSIRSGKKVHSIFAAVLIGRQVSNESLLKGLGIVAVMLFLMATLLGSMLPSFDFDAKEYHLQGPKEFYQLGRITFLPHNVYTSFPFLTETLSLLAMVLRGDWYWGALAGKAVLMCFAPLTALALFAAGRRWFNPTVGWLAAVIYLSTPWTYRISIIAYAEGGLTFYLFASLLAVMIGIEKHAYGTPSLRQFLLAGVLAGSAMACKYTGVLMVILPLAAAVVVSGFMLRSITGSFIRTTGKSVAAFILGTAIVIGPWLVKNTVETGNPVYPLLYSVFDMVFNVNDWNESLDLKWKAGHSPDTYALSDLRKKFVDVTTKSDWLSPLLFGLAPLALFAAGTRPIVWSLWLFVVYLFLAWWLFTHRIDRFWIPLIPVVSLLAGIGATCSSTRLWQYVYGTIMTLAVIFNLGFITTHHCGYNAYLGDINQARSWSEFTAAGIQFLNRMNLTNNTKVLCVGEAQVFDARFPVVYNTVFDRSIFQQWCAMESEGISDGNLAMRDPEQIRQKFLDEGITHVYVNWREILRYRPTYGYSDFVTPERFIWLRHRNVLGRAIHAPESYDDVRNLQPSEKKQLDQWGRALKTTINGHSSYPKWQVFPVTP